MSEAARAYAAHGWALIEFAAGTKGPAYHGWNLPEKATRDPQEAGCFVGNAGLCHAYSNTAALDIDAWDDAALFLQNHGLSLREFYDAPDAVRILSGREGRGKLLFRLPAGTQPLPSLRPKGSGIEFRCAASNGLTVQDVLPPSIHPTTGKPYVWSYGDEMAGHWSALPELPAPILALWRSLLSTPAPSTDNAPRGLAADRLRGMLARLDPDMEYHEWIKVGMALHHEVEGAEQGLDLWDEWSAGGSKYKSAADLDIHWRSFGSSRGRPVTIQSLISMSGGVTAEDFDDLSALPEQPKRARFEVVPAAAFASGPHPHWIIKDVLPAAGMGVLFAESGAGKSFAVFDMASSIARGVPWNGKRVRQGRVVIVAAEGAGGMRKRVAAYAQHHGVDLVALGVGIIAERPNLLKEDHKALAAAVNAWGGADVIVVDTLAASMPGGDENSGEDMGALLNRCQALHAMTGALVLLVHHSGKDAARGARGWSGIKAAMDVELEILRDGDQRSLRVSKQKDGEDGIGWGFKLVVVNLGLDADGDPITSCVVEWGELAATNARSEPKGKWQKAVWQVVLDNLELCGDAVPTRLVLDHAMALVPKDPNGIDRRREYARRALEGLILEGWLLNQGDTVAVVRS